MNKEEQGYLDYIQDLLFSWYMGDFKLMTLKLEHGANGERGVHIIGYDKNE